MNVFRACRRVSGRRGVSVVELLCVVTIIFILASLLLGPVLKAYRKAKNFAAEVDGGSYVQMTVKRLRTFHQTHASYPPLTAKYLHEQGVFDSRFMQYLREKQMVYFPFSSTDSDTNQIIWYDITRTGYNAVLKSDVTQ